MEWTRPLLLWYFLYMLFSFLGSVDVNSEPERRSLDPTSWVDLHGDALFRFAILRVKDADTAEDLVQETFLSALKAADRFRGDSALRTWLIGILRHKIVDHFRKSVVEVHPSDVTPWGEDEKDFFDATGHWSQEVHDWKISPERLVESGEFWAVFQSCLGNLPEAHRRAFTLREIDGMSGREICEILSISESNLGVMLHRARSKLRLCLNDNWFRAPSVEAS